MNIKINDAAKRDIARQEVHAQDWRSWKNVGDMWCSQVDLFQNRTMAVAKIDGRWKDISWKEADRVAKSIASGLLSLKMKKNESVTIFSKTRIEWIYVAIAIIQAGGRLVCIYHTDSPSQCEHIIKNSDTTVCFVEEQEQLDKILAIRKNCPTLRSIVCFEKYDPKALENVYHYRDFLEIGRSQLNSEILREIRGRIQEANIETDLSLIYTSGTTGYPKGAIITHGNTLFCCWAFTKVFPIGKDDLAFCFLPLAHAGGLTLTLFSSISAGCPIAVAEDMMNTAMEDMYETEPTWMFCTPRLYEKIYNKIIGIMDEAPWFRKYLIQEAITTGIKIARLKQKQKSVPIHMRILYFVYNLLVFRKIKDMFGGRMTIPFTGGAPIAPKVIEFFAAIGMPLIEVFGQTETSSIIMCNRMNQYKIGTVGTPIPGIEVRLAEEGEIQVNAPMLVCRGYNKDRQATKSLFTEDGWLKTGDIGEIDEDGYYSVIDRKKYIIITAAGKNVAPQHIENILKTHRFISQAIVYGEAKPYLICLFTLDEDEVTRFARDQRIIYQDFRSLTKNRRILEKVWKIVNEKNKELARVEQIKKFFILEEELFQDDEEVTPTMKVKKSVIEKRYGDIINQLYKLPKSEFTLNLRKE